MKPGKYALKFCILMSYFCSYLWSFRGLDIYICSYHKFYLSLSLSHPTPYPFSIPHSLPVPPFSLSPSPLFLYRYPSLLWILSPPPSHAAYQNVSPDDINWNITHSPGRRAVLDIPCLLCIVLMEWFWGVAGSEGVWRRGWRKENEGALRREWKQWHERGKEERKGLKRGTHKRMLFPWLAWNGRVKKTQTHHRWEENVFFCEPTKMNSNPRCVIDTYHRNYRMKFIHVTLSITHVVL